MSEMNENDRAGMREWLALYGIDYDKLVAEAKKEGIPITRDLIEALIMEASRPSDSDADFEAWEIDAEADYPDELQYDD